MFFVHCYIPSHCLENDCHIVLHAKNMRHLRSGIKLLFPFVVDFGILSLTVILQLGSHSSFADIIKNGNRWESTSFSALLSTAFSRLGTV